MCNENWVILVNVRNLDETHPSEYDDDEEGRSDGSHVYKKNCGIGSKCAPKSQCGADGKLVFIHF